MIPFYTENDKQSAEEKWRKVQREGKTRFGLSEEKSEVMQFTLQLLHSLSLIRLHKYVKNPKAERTHIFENMKSLFVRITHEGYKKRLGRKLYYAPNLFGIVSHKSDNT